jgi:hypothetical protein
MPFLQASGRSTAPVRCNSGLNARQQLLQSYERQIAGARIHRRSAPIIPKRIEHYFGRRELLAINAILVSSKFDRTRQSLRMNPYRGLRDD